MGERCGFTIAYIDIVYPEPDGGQETCALDSGHDGGHKPWYTVEIDRLNTLVVVVATKCGDCDQPYTNVENLLDGKLVWSPPRKKRGACQHPPSSAQVRVHGAGDRWWASGQPIKFEETTNGADA